jgi:hypothetical protein
MWDYFPSIVKIFLEFDIFKIDVEELTTPLAEYGFLSK